MKLLIFLGILIHFNAKIEKKNAILDKKDANIGRINVKIEYNYLFERKYRVKY